MKKLINYNKNYKIIVEDSEKYSDQEIKSIARNAIKNLKSIKDVPYNAPEDTITITHNEKVSGGKNALTHGMLETAMEEKWKDNGKAFEAYFQDILDSINDDIANAKYIVSGETEDTRKKLLEEYIRIETILRHGKETEKLNQLKPLVDKLSDLLHMDHWREPQFPERKRVKASNELRAIHRYDSTIKHKYAPVFLCTPTELKASYNDAKVGKLPEVFEGNLEKVRKDMEADYDRILAGKDNYTTDPLIKQTLPEIIDHYETALKYAIALDYEEYANKFETMLKTIKKAWSAFI
jgi:hypothetical protein